MSSAPMAQTVVPGVVPGSPWPRLGSEQRFRWVAFLGTCWLPIERLAPSPPLLVSLLSASLDEERWKWRLCDFIRRMS